MNTTDYEEAKNLLRQIDFNSSQMDLVREQWNTMTDEGGTAKLVICTGRKSYETVLTEDAVNAALNAIMERHRRIIKESQDRLNKLIEYNTPVE